MAIEVGGGIRTTEHIRTLIDGGIRRAIVGTKACSVQSNGFSVSIIAIWASNYRERQMAIRISETCTTCT